MTFNDSLPLHSIVKSTVDLFSTSCVASLVHKPRKKTYTESESANGAVSQPFQPQYWLASIFSLQYHCLVKHLGHENRGIDHQR